jgi:hypothetical protein
MRAVDADFDTALWHFPSPLGGEKKKEEKKR